MTPHSMLRPHRAEVYITLCVCGVESEHVASEVDKSGELTCEYCGRTARLEWAQSRDKGHDCLPRKDTDYEVGARGNERKQAA